MLATLARLSLRTLTRPQTRRFSFRPTMAYSRPMQPTEALLKVRQFLQEDPTEGQSATGGASLHPAVS